MQFMAFLRWEGDGNAPGSAERVALRAGFLHAISKWTDTFSLSLALCIHPQLRKRCVSHGRHRAPLYLP